MANEDVITIQSAQLVPHQRRERARCWDAPSAPTTAPSCPRAGTATIAVRQVGGPTDHERPHHPPAGEEASKTEAVGERLGGAPLLDRPVAAIRRGAPERCGEVGAGCLGEQEAKA